jgi:flavodoxin
MKECVWAIYFSPTGGTKKAAFYLAESLGKEVKEVDLSAPDFNGAEFKKDDLVIVAAPAFGGRIPALMAERLKCTAGKGAAAVTAAVYGNRAYEDALVELNDALEEQGFEPFASVAVLAEFGRWRQDVRMRRIMRSFPVLEHRSLKSLKRQKLQGPRCRGTAHIRNGKRCLQYR